MRLPSGEICTSSVYSSWNTSMECRRWVGGRSVAPADTTNNCVVASTKSDVTFTENPLAGCARTLAEPARRDESPLLEEYGQATSRGFLAGQFESFATSEIFAFSTFDTGQPDLVTSAISANFASLMLGTLAMQMRSLCVIAKPSPTFSSRTAALVSMESAVKPSLPRPTESAIVKHAACAAAISSSGFVPGPSSKRDLKP